MDRCDIFACEYKLMMIRCKQKMKNMKKVFYNKGDNVKYDYYIEVGKEEVNINKNSLSFKIGDTIDKVEIINKKGFSANFDYIICEIDKIKGTKTFIFCSESEIQF